jgi:hypothetical protein
MADGDYLPRVAALEAIAQRWPTHPDALPLLRTFGTNDRSEQVRRAAIEQLASGWPTDPDALPFLREAASNDHESGAAGRGSRDRGLIIGDPNQLQHITQLSERDETEHWQRVALTPEWLRERRLGFASYSAYHAFAAAAEQVLWLDEHYRCHPAIAEVANRRFYGGRLTVLTDPARLAVRDGAPINWVEVTGKAERPPGGSCHNVNETRRVVELVGELDASLTPSASLGVVTPLAAQRTPLRRLMAAAALSRSVDVGTVHTFQGDERDIIVISPVATPEIKPQTASWLLGQKNLWNVAVTRARSRVYAVGDRRFWERRDGVVSDLLRGGEGGEELAHSTEVSAENDSAPASLPRSPRTRRRGSDGPGDRRLPL